MSQPRTRELHDIVGRITIGHDGDRFILGRPDLNIFIAVPEPGAVFIRALQEGGSIEEATARASAIAGEVVDGEDFLSALRGVGLLAPPEASGPDSTAVGGSRRRIRWIEGVSPRVARRLFGRTAWGCYGGAAVFALGVLAARPDLRPSWEHAWWLTDPLLSLLAYLPVGLLLVATHEAWHWLAGRAAGVPAAFRVSYRGIWVVFETDLSQLVTIDRRRRYGPFLAGMAIDAVLLALALGLRLLYREELLQVPPVVDRFLGAVVFYQVVVIIWQWAAIPFRTDGYAVLANALGCHNLYRTTWLTLKDRLVVIGADERAELDRADARDRSVAAWFAVVYLAGATVMAWSFMTFAVPLLLVMGGWAITNLASLATGTAAFWESLAVLAYLIANLALPPLLALREHRTGRSREVTP